MRGLGRYGEGMTETADDRASALSQRVLRAQVQLAESMRHMADSMARLEVTRQAIQASRSQREALHDGAYARLQARLATLPAIEQAKGVIMAQTGCSPEEAFDLLRRASQRGNIPVRELALAVVARAGDCGPGLFGGQDRRG
jgi:hypothetical protein